MPKVDLTRRPVSREDLASWYAVALAEQESSGLSVADFADELGVTATTLYHWRRRLAADTAKDGRGSPSSIGLVEVTVGSRVVAGDTGSFVVRLAADRSIEVPCAFDDADLRRLVTVLESC